MVNVLKANLNVISSSAFGIQGLLTLTFTLSLFVLKLHSFVEWMSSLISHGAFIFANERLYRFSESPSTISIICFLFYKGKYLSDWNVNIGRPIQLYYSGSICTKIHQFHLMESQKSMRNYIWSWPSMAAVYKQSAWILSLHSSIILEVIKRSVSLNSTDSTNQCYQLLWSTM